ncbi:latexin [Sarcophilus harrisii]|uniref:Latexin n=1 Tax=Sarcophilus harrisii TaxID=9305 RepID=A0A7N4NVV8_SARHA|nr:latexin [Sarcophilus harrisii]
MEELHPSHYPARRAATLVQNYINYQVGTPHKVYLFGKVTQATLEDIPGRGHKYHLKFTLGEMVKNEIMVNCEAQVFYPTTGENTVPEVEYTFLGDAGKNTDEEDNKFYESLKSMKKPLKAKKIPDDYGYIPPELKPVRHLAIVASGYVIWQHSSEKTCYNMAWVENVKQVKREDDFIELDYNVLIHNFVSSQDMNPCQIQVLWHPQYGVKVKHYKRQLHRKQ